MDTTRLAIVGATLFDSVTGSLRPGTTLVVEGERIAHVTQEAIAVDGAARIIDAGGRVVLPGLIDAHVHATAVSHDVLALSMQPPSLITAQSKGLLEAMLLRGFTTIRDAAGADFGLQEAVTRGLFAGPRMFIAAHPITQTGGHADIRPKGTKEVFCTCAGLGIFGAIADGVGEVRKAVREQVRNGANQIKVMAGGGIASPTDPIDGTQYSLEELRAICEEADAANLYVMAHAYSPRAITRAVQSGVRSIEHGNLLDEASARVMKAEGAFLVPTLATYEALGAEGERLGWSAAMLAKLARVQERGIDAIRIAQAEGVPIAFGSDLLGAMQSRQSREFALRLPAQTPVEILQGATAVAARLLRQEGQIGVVAPGALADLLIVDGDPAASLAMFEQPDTGLRLILQGGRCVKDTLAGVA